MRWFFSDINIVYAAESVKKHAPDTEALITIVEHNADFKRLLVQSIKQAKQINPDKETEPGANTGRILRLHWLGDCRHAL